MTLDWRKTRLFRFPIRETSRRRSPRRARWMQVETLENRELLAADVLYIGDAGTDSVQSFDAGTGAYLGEFVEPGAAGLHGPAGMIFSRESLLLVNQNVNTASNGEVLRFEAATGAPQSPLVDGDSAQAPFAPRGIVLRDNVLYVADFEGTTHPGISKYDATTGNFVGELLPDNFEAEFRPRGLVFGPDGGLFVTVFSEDLFDSVDPAGYILRFDTKTGASRVVAWNDGDGVNDAGEVNNLHNPEGLAFSPDGSLYVTSNYGGQTTQNTHILVIDPSTGRELRNIELDPHARPDNPTAIFAQAVLFGPSDKLFIPITSISLNDGLALGGVWTFDPATKDLTSFVTPSLFEPVLQFPAYLTFQQTNPATLAYQPWHNFDDSLDVDHSGSVIPLDVLLVINELNHRTVASENGKLQSSRGTSEYYYDVNADGYATPIDALLILNYLNRLPRAASIPTPAVAALPQSLLPPNGLASSEGSQQIDDSMTLPRKTMDSIRVQFAAAVDEYFAIDSPIVRRETQKR